jgi:hypothetical protein
VNYSRRHSYYVTKTIQWLERQGYIADKVEYTGMAGGRYVKRDLWGADIIYRGLSELGFVQVKTSEAQISKGRRQLTSDTCWPPFITRSVVYWPPRASEPIVEYVR